jgi:uncharacterized protein (DUF2062 family)
MPTAAKLFAALFFAILGFVTAQLYHPGLPEGTPLGLLRETCAGIGVICGWRISGALAGRGTAEAIATGVRTTVTMAVVALFVFASWKMLKQSTRLRYDGPMEAVLAVFQEFLDYGRLMLVPEVIGALAIGGLIGGLLTEAVGRRWQ